MDSEAVLRARWDVDRALLEQIGHQWVSTDLPKIRVELRRDLAEQAVAAWQRDDDGDIAPDTTVEDANNRRAAARLALIGLAIEERGVWTADAVSVEVSALLVAEAIDLA